VTTSAVPENFLTEQVQLLEAGNTAALAEKYAEDAVFVRFDRTARGRSEIKELFDDYLKAGPVIAGLDGASIQDNVVFYQAKETLNGGLVTAVGTLVFTDGQVWRQTVAFVQPFG
jgi:ketosteroid isomerase-like protein